MKTQNNLRVRPVSYQPYYMESGSVPVYGTNVGLRGLLNPGGGGGAVPFRPYMQAPTAPGFGSMMGPMNPSFGLPGLGAGYGAAPGAGLGAGATPGAAQGAGAGGGGLGSLLQGLNLPNMPFNLKTVQSFVDGMGGIDGIIGQVNKVQELYKGYQQIKPLLSSILGGFLANEEELAELAPPKKKARKRKKGKRPTKMRAKRKINKSV